ncbi:MAG: outer membrane protein transport protein, partial [Gammaproteobacteria bacterium]|nr:outer membrane protein transport protein [Gammaproteobacteria bacterium]
YATLTSLKTIDFTPSLGVAITPKFSVGFGLDYEYLQAQFDDVAFDNTDYFDHNKMSDTAWGFHTGMLYQFTPQSRVGLMYHSAINHNAEGTGDLQGDITGGPSNPSMPLELPSMTTLSYFQGITDRWAMMSSLSYVTWKSVQDFQVSGIQTVAGPVNVVVPMNFRNTWTAAVGTTYQLSTAWQWKFGVAYDQSPTNDQDREPRLPDSDRREVATGFHYQANNSLGFDAGYMHIYARPTSVNKTTSLPLDSVTTTGSFANSSDVFGLQVTWKFV